MCFRFPNDDEVERSDCFAEPAPAGRKTLQIKANWRVLRFDFRTCQPDLVRDFGAHNGSRFILQ
jgi:hypothetical protein